VVSNLWDVTDRDIDRFCEALLGTWLGPKTTEAASEASMNGGPGGGDAKGMGGRMTVSGARSSIGAAVSRGRAACKLPHLIGAAPVCYGIPTEAFYCDPR
jgi:separase